VVSVVLVVAVRLVVYPLRRVAPGVGLVYLLGVPTVSTVLAPVLGAVTAVLSIAAFDRFRVRRGLRLVGVVLPRGRWWASPAAIVPKRPRSAIASRAGGTVLAAASLPHGTGRRVRKRVVASARGATREREVVVNSVER
jgi:hypothetical protein